MALSARAKAAELQPHRPQRAVDILGQIGNILQPHVQSQQPFAHPHRLPRFRANRVVGGRVGSRRLSLTISIFLHRPNLPSSRRTAPGAALFQTVENRRRFGVYTGTRSRMCFINLRRTAGRKAAR